MRTQNNLIFIFLIAFFLIGCSTLAPAPTATPTIGPCDEGEVYNFIVLVHETIIKINNEVIGEAIFIPEVSMSEYLLELQTIRDNFEEVYAPKCAQQLKEYMMRYLDESVDSFDLYINGDSEAFTENLNLIIAHNNIFEEIERIEACVPDCPIP